MDEIIKDYQQIRLHGSPIQQHAVKSHKNVPQIFSADSFERMLQTNERYPDTYTEHQRRKRNEYKRQKHVEDEMYSEPDEPLYYQSKSMDEEDEFTRRQMINLKGLKSTSLPENNVDPPMFQAPDFHMERQRLTQRHERGQLPSSPLSSPLPTSPLAVHDLLNNGRHRDKQTQDRLAQRRGFSSNSHPYDRIFQEKHLRRILSEDAHDHILKTRKSDGLRRASSYDNFRSFAKNQHNNALASSTQIMFPEHYDVHDYKDMFVSRNGTQHMMGMTVAQRRHAMKKCVSEDGKYRKYRIDSENDCKKDNKSPTTVDNQEIGPYVYDELHDNDVAISVTGLLTLPGSNEKRYPITVGEMRRRIAPPEFLNKVDMISYVRLAKSSARELLEKHTIRPKHHSRKSKHSVISKMCEAECREFTNGVRSLGDLYFPNKWLAQRSINQHTSNDCTTISERQHHVDITRSVLRQFVETLQSSQACDELQHYNLATHSYGLLDLINNIDLIEQFLKVESDQIGHILSEDMAK